MTDLQRVFEGKASRRGRTSRLRFAPLLRRFAIVALAFCLMLSELLPGPSWAAPVSPETGDASLSFSPAPAGIQGCETIPVEVWVNDVIDLYGVDIQLAFDAAVLEVVDADPGETGVQVQIGGFLSPDFVVGCEADNTAGTAQYTVSQVSPSLPVDGSGVLFTVLFRAKSAATASALTFTQADLVDLDGRLLSVTAVDGNVSAAAPAPSALAISRTNATDVWLSWTASPGVAEYRLYRSTLPYFAPVDPAYRATGDLGYGDLGVLGNPAINYYYVVTSACASGFCSQPLSRVGKFEFLLVPGGS